MKSKINPRFLFSSTFVSPIVAVLTLTAPAASADTLNSSVDLRVTSPDGVNFTNLSLFNNGSNIQRIFLNFDLSSYSGNSVTTDATLTLRGDASYGNNLTGVSLGTANAAWDAGTINYGNQPSLTAIAGATNPNGNFGSVDVNWTIPWYMLEKLATTGSGYNNGLGITSGVNSSLHFNASVGGGPAPTLTFSAATGASSTWTGADGTWTDTANWADSTVAEGIDQAATIDGVTAVNITMDANRSVGSLAFSGADHTIIDESGKLALNVTSGSPTVTVETGRVATIGATVVGIDGLIKTGAGTLVLAGANTYTGATILTNGVLSVETIDNGGVASGNLGSATSAAANLVFNGGTLQYIGSTATTDRNFTINAGKAAIFDIDAGNLTLAGTTPATDGALIKTGAGTLTIDSAQIYTGSTTINEGGLTLTASGLIAAASNIQVDSSTLAITAGGGGRTLANNMVLNGGTVMVQLSADNTGTGGTITFSGGNVIHTFTSSGSLDLPVSIGSVSQLIVGAGGGGGAGVNGNVYNAGGGGGQVLNLTAQSLASGTTTVVVGTGGTGGDNASGTSGGASSIGGNTAAGGLGANDANGTGGKSGSGQLGAGRNNGYFGGGGGGDSAAGSGTNGGAGTTGTLTGLIYGGGGGAGPNGVGGVGGGGNGDGGSSPTAGTANTGGGGGGGGTSAAGGSGIVIVQYPYTTAGGVVTLNGTVDLQSASTLDASGADGLLDVSGLISSSVGSGGLTIASSGNPGGVVRFSSANSYLGNTTVNTGTTLRMNTTNALPSGSGKGNLSLNGTLDLNAQATTSLNGLSGAGTIDNTTGVGSYALAMGNNNQTSDFSGVIQDTTGTLGLTKAGNGIQTLSGTNTYSGDTTVDAGTLKFTSPNTSNQASTVTIATTGATLELAYSGTDTVKKLFIGATQMADGIYKSSTNPGAGTAIAQITGAGTLTVNSVVALSNYASWANDPSKGNIPGEPSTGDFDNDGLTNLTEYALGKNPRTSSQPAGELSGNIITFTKGADAIANGDVSWVIETSTTLAPGSWTPQVTQPAGNLAATISYILTPASPAANFARLKVTQN